MTTAAMQRADGVDPDRVPKRRLYTGAQIPVVGLGTFGSDHVTGEVMAAAVGEAIALGYRHIDCASVYGNEHLIGPVLAGAMRDGRVRREDLWITSKVWNDSHGRVEVSCRKSLEDLRLDYLDLYLVHWPFPNFHPPHCDVTSRSPDAKPYIHADFMKTWRQMEKLVDLGLVRHIGVSNMTIPKLEKFLPDARIKPACAELELHPHLQQKALFDYVVGHGMAPIGYCPIGSPGRPERDRTPEDTVDVEDPVIVKIAERLGVHPAVVCVKWSAQRGAIPIPMSTKRRNLLANLACVTTPPLTAEDMKAIAGIDRNCRLVKGHVFLWKDGQTWEALWDVDGTITPP